MVMTGRVTTRTESVLPNGWCSSAYTVGLNSKENPVNKMPLTLLSNESGWFKHMKQISELQIDKNSRPCALTLVKANLDSGHILKLSSFVHSAGLRLQFWSQITSLVLFIPFISNTIWTAQSLSLWTWFLLPPPQTYLHTYIYFLKEFQETTINNKRHY